MSTPPPAPETYATHLTAFLHLLTASIHTLLYHRGLYPPSTFLTVRAHHATIQQSRHPAVIRWINDAIDAIRPPLLAGNIARIALVIYGPPPPGASPAAAKSATPPTPKPTTTTTLLERWMFDTSAFPTIPAGAQNLPLEVHNLSSSRPTNVPEPSQDQDATPAPDVEPHSDPDADTHVQHTAYLLRLSMTAAGLPPLTDPRACSWNIVVELRDEDEDERVQPPMAVVVEEEGEEEGEEGEGEREGEEGGDGAKESVARVRFVGKEGKEEAGTEKEGMRRTVDPPLEHPQRWIPVQPREQVAGRREAERKAEGATAKRKRNRTVVPVRKVEGRVLEWECWVEREEGPPRGTGNRKDDSVKGGS